MKFNNNFHSKLPALLAVLLFSVKSFAQPLPCPPINTTSVTGTGGTVICGGGCTNIGALGTTTVKSTSDYTFSTIPYLPTSYTGGTPILVGIDDVYSGLVPLPFPFCFYGNKYTQCVIGANGQICFDASEAGAYNDYVISGPMPTSASPEIEAQRNCIMGAYYDMDPALGGAISWAIYGTAPCRTFVVSWNNIPLYNTGFCPGLIGTEQIVLYESTYAIDVFIHNKPLCTAWNSGFSCLGIENATGTSYVFAPGKNGTDWSVTDEGYRFTPNGPASWTYDWYDHFGAYVGTGNPITVCPLDSMTYTVKAIASSNCDSYTVYTSVFVGIGGSPSVRLVTHTDPSRCDLCNGSIKLYGLVPGLSDTIYCKMNGVVQPGVVQVVASDSTLLLSGLCNGIYDSVTVVVGQCHTIPKGPYTLIGAPLTIGTATFTNPTACGICDGTLTISGLVPGKPYSISYNFNSIAQTPVSVTTSPLGTCTLTGLCEGTYDNIVGTIGTCPTPAIGPYTLVAPVLPNVNIIAVTSPTQCGKCDGLILMGNTIPFSSDTISYFYNSVAQPSFVTNAFGDGTIHLPGLCAGSYYSFSIKIGACSVNVPGTAILTDPPLKASFTNTTHLGCHGDSVLFSNTSYSTGPLYYTWNYGDGSSDSAVNPVHVYQAGTYTVYLTATDHYCVNVDSTTFTLGHPLTAVFTETPDILCQNQTAITTNTSVGATGYLWLFSNHASDTAANATYTYQRAGTYDLILIAHNDIPCFDTLHKTVYVDTISGLNISLTDSVSCSGTHITMTGLYASLGNTGISWNFGDGDSVLNKSAVQHSYNSQGTYTVAATAHYRACPDASATRIINVFQQPQINVGKDTSICKGSEAITIGDYMNNDNTGVSWRWNTGETTRQITVVAPGLYWATVNINNCYASDSIEVSNDCYVNIPNAFTPNGDGVNDYFFPRQYLSRGLTEFKMNIYNRWGQLIFETTSLDGAGWDGKLNGVDQPGGVYVYIIDAAFHDGQREHHQGNITLLR